MRRVIGCKHYRCVVSFESAGDGVDCGVAMNNQQVMLIVIVK